MWVMQLYVQLLAQMGIAGQTLFANSDGTISVDGSLLTIQGRPVQLASQWVFFSLVFFFPTTIVVQIE